MATDVTMPRLSDSMEEGTILNWIVEEGAEVKRGEPLVEIETDKANMTYESDTDGVLIEVVAREGDTLPIGEVIARIGERGEKPSGDGDAPGKAAEAESKAEEAKSKAAEAERALGGDAAERDAAGGNGAGERVKASPVARRMARDMGVETQELTRIQRTVSRRMAESKATAPDYALHMEVDMTLCVELRRRLKEVEDPAPSFNDMIVKACANALREHPRVNGAYRDGRFELYSAVNVGIAVAAQEALVVPTIHDADKKSLGEIARQARELIAKVRDGKITPPEVSGGTFTVSNLGMYGVDYFTAIINPPQAALLTVGSLKKRPAVDDGGRVVPRDQLTLSLVCDHRILYGADGAQFLARVRELLEQPLALAL